MSNETPADIEVLRQRFQSLSSQKSKVEALLQRTESELADLRQQAETQFGTSDLDALRLKLSQMEAENVKMRASYETLLNGITKELNEIEEPNA